MAARMMALLLGSAGIVGMMPIAAFANTGPEADCICDVKCTEEKINDQCPVCSKDYTQCQGTEPEKQEETVPEQAAEPETDTESEGPLTPDGNMTLVDDYGNTQKSGKQFITMTTKNGNYFYLIIDRDDKGNESVHFLNQVDESDLLSLMDEDEVKAYAAEKTKDEEEPPEVKEPEETKPVEVPESEPAKKPKSTVPAGPLLLILLIGVGSIGAYVYKKVGKKNQKENVPDPDADYKEDTGEDYLDELEKEETADVSDIQGSEEK